jgi:glycerol-3-phosphate acyltransferase PlsY
VYRLAGLRAGIAVFAGDAAKGAIATAAGRAAGGPELALACGLAAVVGHCFPVFRRFRGGRGVATAAGTIAMLEPLVALPFVALWIAIARLTGKASLASLAVMSGVPVAVFVLDRPRWEQVGVGALAAVVVARHAGNLVRLARGEEPELQPTAS